MFMIIDWITYKFSIGRYSEKGLRKRYPINIAWEGKYESAFEEILKPGDMLFFHKNRSTISWAVQYFTKTDISHTGVYIGNGEVLHATLANIEKRSLKYFFDAGYKVIFVHMGSNDKKDYNVDFSDLLGENKYPLQLQILRAFCIFIGIPWSKYRITYAFDLGIILLILSLGIFHKLIFLPIIIIFCIYVFIVFVNFILRKKKKIPVYDPGTFLLHLPDGFSIIPSVYKLNEQWFINALKEKEKCPN